MQTIPVKRVFNAITSRMGQSANVLLTPQRALELSDIISSRVSEAYENEFWPETMLVEQRLYTGTTAYSATATYALNAIVYHDTTDAYWYSLTAGNTGHTPAEGSAFWARATSGFVRSLSFNDAAYTPVGRVDLTRCVYANSPLIYEDPVPLTPIRMLDDVLYLTCGANIQPWPNQPYLRFQRRPPEFSLEPWESGTDYEAGDLRYLGSTGHTYKALVDNTGERPDSSASWEIVGFPTFLFAWVRDVCAADRLTEETGKYQALGAADAKLERLRNGKIDSTNSGRRARWQMKR